MLLGLGMQIPELNIGIYHADSRALGMQIPELLTQVGTWHVGSWRIPAQHKFVSEINLKSHP